MNFGNLLRNGTAEHDVRDWLNNNGYYGRSAKFGELELHAIKRPGWLQVFRFSVAAKTTSDEWHDLYGVLRDDERYRRLDIEVSTDLTIRDERLAEWSTGLIVRRRSRRRP
ncbi:MAG: hypothetical protein P8J33_09960 [Pirellulaceae bacterium]|nr:hypothetical protein [Pirellulaceae bacterium]